MCDIRSLAGCKVLELLEIALGRNNLSKCSLREMQALFLVLFGTILAVGYSKPKPMLDCHKLPKHCASSADTSVAAQRQLLRILSHHMIQLGERAGLIDEGADRDQIIEESYCQWHAKACFQWDETSMASVDELRAEEFDLPWKETATLDISSDSYSKEGGDFTSSIQREMPPNNLTIFDPSQIERLSSCTFSQQLESPMTTSPDWSDPFDSQAVDAKSCGNQTTAPFDAISADLCVQGFEVPWSGVTERGFPDNPDGSFDDKENLLQTKPLESHNSESSLELAFPKTNSDVFHPNDWTFDENAIWKSLYTLMTVAFVTFAALQITFEFRIFSGPVLIRQ
ncbi:hypothetical protein ACLMJK_002404 [Lecanora helva]